METKITTANIRIALSHQYSTFEVSAQLSNENGIDIVDIEKARKDCQKLANDAVNEFKNLPNSSPKVELQRVENKLAELKKMIDPKKERADNATPEEVENLPLYTDTKAKK